MQILMILWRHADYKIGSARQKIKHFSVRELNYGKHPVTKRCLTPPATTLSVMASHHQNHLSINVWLLNPDSLLFCTWRGKLREAEWRIDEARHHISEWSSHSSIVLLILWAAKTECAGFNLFNHWPTTVMDCCLELQTWHRHKSPPKKYIDSSPDWNDTRITGRIEMKYFTDWIHLTLKITSLFLQWHHKARICKKLLDGLPWHPVSTYFSSTGWALINLLMFWLLL